MSTIPFTNTTGDGQVPGVNPDATTDYFLVSDYNNDKNYWHAKICEAIKFMSGSPEEDFQILYGGVVSDAGTSKINISEGAAIGKDTEGNFRIIRIPSLSNITLPSGWTNDRQIWVIGKYNTKLNSTERQHFNGVTYYYQFLDSYLGEDDSEDLFLDSDPGDTVVKWGSFKMNGTTFVSQNGRTEDWTSSLKAKIENSLLQPGDMIPVVNGNRAGFLPCYGGAYSRTIYSNLFAAMPKEYGTATITIANPAVVTLSATQNDSTPTTGNTIQFTTTGSLPTTGVSAGVIYYLRYTGSGSVYHLYDTLANAMNTTATTGRVATTGSQSGTHSYEIYYFGNGNGTSTFHVPDLRGVVPRGIGTSNGYISSVSILAGQRTDDQFQGHWHEKYSAVLSDGGGSGYLYYEQTRDPSGKENNTSLGADNQIRNPITDGTNGTPRAGTETRGKSLGVYYAIKY
ncbi:hypothetical protein [Leptospira sp. 'Mane']|uniref:hypothetical protein n=1 Tax=Leptospira sp. 'Mane' TaxID=3387407 RepID=UPI00398BA782